MIHGNRRCGGGELGSGLNTNRRGGPGRPVTKTDPGLRPDKSGRWRVNGAGLSAEN